MVQWDVCDPRSTKLHSENGQAVDRIELRLELRRLAAVFLVPMAPAWERTAQWLQPPTTWERRAIWAYTKLRERAPISRNALASV